MESEKMISKQKKYPFQFYDSQKKFELVNEVRRESGVFDDGKNERNDSREEENLFFDFSRIENISIRTS